VQAIVWRLGARGHAGANRQSPGHRQHRLGSLAARARTAT
jgi:hypothetical protein